MEISKQSVGIDVSKDTLEIQFKELIKGKVRIKGSTKFKNNPASFEKLLTWCNKREKGSDIVYIMEATGVYHEDLLYYLHEEGKNVCVELPQIIKYFAKSKGIKTKNDKIDSSVIADYGIERKLRFWQPPGAKFKHLRDLSREHTALTEAKSIAVNRLHAAKHAHEKDIKIINRLHVQIEFYSNQLTEIEDNIKVALAEDKELTAKVKNIITIKGVAVLTAVKVISETNGFYLFNNISQLVSYSGLDVTENQSGKYSGKTRISKKGNSLLRKALYMPALSAIQHDEKMKTFNDRIMETHLYKKQGIVAVMRKLLILIYTLWKKNEPYNSNFVWGQ